MGGRRFGTCCGCLATVGACEQRANCAVAERDSWCIAPENTCHAIPLRRRRLHRFVGRCGGSQPAFAIGRTIGSLVVICGEQTGPYEYLGVRLSDAAMLRTAASTNSTHGFLARRAGVLYAVSPRELKVTAGSTVIKQEPMIEYRELAR